MYTNFFVFQNVKRLLSVEYARAARSRIKDGRVLPSVRDYFISGAPKASSSDEGTAHFAIVAPDGSAASITTTVNTLYAGFDGHTLDHRIVLNLKIKITISTLYCI